MAAEALDAITCRSQPLGLSFHPTREVLACGLVDGSVELHNYSARTKHTQLTLHGAASRSTCFVNDGSQLVSAGSDGKISFLDSERLDIIWEKKEAHASAINRSFFVAGRSNLLASGDDDGVIKLWDIRTESPVFTFDKLHTDFISGFDSDKNGTTLLASSGDCTLSALDLRSLKNKSGDKQYRQSDDQEDELLSVLVMKNGKKVVCGTQEGVLAVWTWGTWGDQGHRMPGHPQSIDALLKIDEDTIITGSSDGMLRVVQLMPDKLLGILGDHDGFPIEELKWSYDRKVIGSTSYDDLIRMWDASILLDDDDDDDDDDEEEAVAMDADEVDTEIQEKKNSTKMKMDANSDDDWEDVDDDSDDDRGMENSDDSDSDDEEDAMQKGKRRFMTDNERFFQDL